MIEKSILVQMLKEFFDKQVQDGLQARFVNELSDDFDRVMKDFNDYVTKKNLQLDGNVNKVDFHDAAKMIMDEVCAFKIQAIKFQHKMLIESAERAKEMAMRRKGAAH